MQKDKPTKDVKPGTDVIFYGKYLETAVRGEGMLRNYLVLQVTNIEERIPHKNLYNQVINLVNDYHSRLKDGYAVTVFISFVPEQNLENLLGIFYNNGATLRQIATNNWEDPKRLCEGMINIAKRYQNDFNMKNKDSPLNNIKIDELIREIDDDYRTRHNRDKNE